ncbi:hypothetical protein ABIA33_000115 [Streptacidiphilus sp. MAP12-16]|jgi:hypothetical protein|uniref:hypothetical protein n=1 Tax=Streptacidiphilus sp. MAP12-16 TaxID=3156300 RepID=UPI003511EBA8
MTSSDVSPRESRQLAVASATLGPWRTAGAVGVVGGAAALGVDLITLHWSLGILAGPASIALFLFFLVGGVGSVVGRRGGERRLRRWAAEHPWQTALAPAGALAVTNTITQFLLSSDGVFASILTGLWHAAILGVVIGVVGAVAGARRRDNA